jgi:ferric-dicitrate binding protein FerR (iron transport regulator)
MNNASRIATLLFLHSRNEISPAEEKELLEWRRQSPDNEETFKDLSDPLYVQKMMAGFYKDREIVYNNLKRKLPDLSGSSLSTAPTYVADPATETFSEEYRMNFPEKQLADSRLSKAAFWESMLADIETEENDVARIVTGKPALFKVADGKPARHRTTTRSMRKFLRLAAAVVVVGLGLYVFDMTSRASSPNRFVASFTSSDGAIDKFLDDAERGFYAGKSDISIEENAKGEQIWSFSNHPNRPKDYSYTLKTKIGNEFILKLPDGSQIWMNAESSIRFPANFSQDTINLAVTGEAYLEIAGAGQHHYSIKSAVDGPHLTNREIQLQTNGGQFNLSAYGNDPVTRVNMIQGTASVQMEGDKTIPPVMIQAGQQAALTNGKLTVNAGVDNNEVLAIKNGEIYFKSATLPTILQVVARWYDVDVKYDVQSTDDKFTLKVPLGSDISVIIDSLRKQGAHILISGKTITIVK